MATVACESDAHNSSESDHGNYLEVKMPALKSYGQMTKEYWKQFLSLDAWKPVPIFLSIGIMFWCFRYIPNYENCHLSQSIFAIIAGALYSLVPGVTEEMHGPFFQKGVVFSKNIFMRISVVLYGFKTSFQDIGEVGIGGAIGSFLMVVVTFSLGSFIAIFFFKIRRSLSYAISIGFSICGIAAVMSAAPIFDATSEDVSLACIMVIVGGFIDIAIYPVIYQYIDQLFDSSERNFGILSGLSIKEVAHTISVGKSCSDNVSKYAIIVKMFKVIILPFGLIVLTIVIPLFEKKKDDENAQQMEDKEEKTLSYKVLKFFNQVNVPWFAFVFIIAIIINSFVTISEKLHNILDELIIVFLSTSMFCVGITTNLRKLFSGYGWQPFVFSFIIYLFVFFFSWLLEYVFKNV